MKNVSLGSTNSFTKELQDTLSQLIAKEKTYLNPIKEQQTLYENRDKAFDTLKTALEKVNVCAEILTKASSINKTQVISTNSAFAATTDSKATNGNYSVEVKTLAAAQSIISGKFSSNTVQQGSTNSAHLRTLNITQLGQEKPLAIQLTDDQTTLIKIRDAINKSNGGVGASIIKVDNDTYYLSITSKNTGTDGKMTISVTGDDTLNSKLSYSWERESNSGAMKQQIAAQNASIKLNGMTIERQSNIISDAIDGVSLILKSKTENEKPEILTISSDIEPMKTAIQNYVNAYNSLQITINDLTKFTAVNPGSYTQDLSNGVLLGNSTVRGVQIALKKQMFSEQIGMDISTLNEIGIKQNSKTGMLEINSGQLAAKLTNNSSSVLDFFIGDGKKTGYATQIQNYLSNVLDSNEGVIKTAKTSVTNTLKSIQKTYDDTQLKIKNAIARYKMQFSKLNAFLAKMEKANMHLTKQLSVLKNK